MNKYWELILKTNNWYDNLNQPKKTLFFIVVFLIPLISSLFLMTYGIKYPIIIWVILVAFWRLPVIKIDI